MLIKYTGLCSRGNKERSKTVLTTQSVTVRYRYYWDVICFIRDWTGVFFALASRTTEIGPEWARTRVASSGFELMVATRLLPLIIALLVLFGLVTVGTGSGLASDLITLPGSELASVKINLPILGDEADHLMVCGWNDLHTMQPRASQNDIERR